MTHTIGEAIEGRLHEMRIQQKELAAVIDVPVSTLNSWLRLGRDIPAQYILKIAHVLRCTPTYLLSGGEDDRETPTKSDAIEDLIRATVAEVLRQAGTVGGLYRCQTYHNHELEAAKLRSTCKAAHSHL